MAVVTGTPTGSFTAPVDRIVERIGRSPHCVIPVLQTIQKEFRYLPEEALRHVCEISEITPAAINSVATFFPQFRFRPAGAHTISVCDGTACHLKGSSAVYDEVIRTLHIETSQDTDDDGIFTVQKVRCLGCCTLAPAVQIDGVTYGHVTTDSVPRMLEDFLAHAGNAAKSHPPTERHNLADGAEIRIGLGSCCVAGGSERIRAALEDTVERFDIPVRIKRVSCVGMCHQTPLLEILFPGLPSKVYAKVQPEDVPPIVLAHFPPRGTLSRARAATSRWLDRVYSSDGVNPVEQRSINLEDAPVSTFLAAQRRIATEFCGEIDPLDFEEYSRRDGFQALAHCLNASETGARAGTAIIDEIARSGLRGRGGAGFPTAAKWMEVRNAGGDEKYVICNGDEGDPGAFMDRMILESYPYRVIEGMLIAAVATGAHKGIFYIRAEYPLAVARVRAAVEKCSQEGILGDSVMGTGFAFTIVVREGAGAFVCGEETGLLASLEGRRPTPRYRPPYPAHKGLNGKPTLVNNVETLSLIPWIIRNGAEAFAELGTTGSKGTKVFALAGKVRRGGLIEVPMGMSIQRIIEDVGGGVAEGRSLKAVQVGGPSGGCIPARLAHLPVDYEALADAGAMMGSGGFVVLDDTDCMVDMSRYFLSFTQLESCGKCTACRVGTRQMLEILTRLCEGKGNREDLEHLLRLASVVKQHSMCALGRTAPNPVLTAMRYFEEEFTSHIEGRCPSHKCKALITYSITQECIGCTKCAQHCPAAAIPLAPYDIHKIDPTKCIRCGGCYEICPVHAVRVD